MKLPKPKLDSAAVRDEFPLADIIPGWFFRNQEVSYGHFIAEGTDLWGRRVSVSGGSDALEQAVKDAREIQRKVDAGEGAA